jgi:hypothetical protein
VHCEERVNFDLFTDEHVDQIWAEAVQLYRAGQPLFMSEDESVEAAIERERFVEEDSIGGVIQEYLDRLVPMNWWSKSPEGRIQWMADRDQGFEPEGDLMIDRVCSIQIWVEALGRRKGDHMRIDLLAITDALKRIPGWKQLPGRTRIPGYGPQVTFIREDLL